MAALDNYLRRRVAQEEDSEPLRELPNLLERCRLWKEASGKEVKAYIGDLCDWSFVAGVFGEFRPEAVVHYAEQPSAPYSMLRRSAAALTIENNLMATANTIFAIREFCPDAHLVKLGTMGEYGTPNIDIEEGWLEVEHKGRQHKFLYPPPGGQPLPHHEGDGHGLALVLCADVGSSGDGLDAGTGLRDGDRREQGASGIVSALCLRRAVRHGAEPVHRAGGGGVSADGLRQGGADAGLPGHPGHLGLHPAFHRESGGQGGSCGFSTSSWRLSR